MQNSAYTFSKNNKGIDLEMFKLYVQTYKENYGEIKENLKDALYVSMNGKLQWLNYLFWVIKIWKAMQYLLIKK